MQWKFRQSRAKIQILAGGFGNGKTTAAVVKAIELANAYPGSNGLIARATYPKLNDTIRKEFLKACDPADIKRKPTQDENSAHLTNGTIVNFRYIAQKGKTSEDGSTTSNLLSASYDWIIIDQIEDPEIIHKDFLDMLGRLRGTTPYRPEPEDEDDTMPTTGPRWLILTANPSQGWFYREVVKPYRDYLESGIKGDKLLVHPETGECIIEMFEGSTYENKDNLEPDYIHTLEASYKGQMRERFLLGKWAAFEGLVHPDYDSKVHLLKRSIAMRHLTFCKLRHVRLKVVEGYDFGLTNPSCYLFSVVDDYGRVIVLDGYYRRDFHYDLQPQYVEDIRAKYDDFVRPDQKINADPAIFRRQVIAGSKKTGETLAKLLKDLDMETHPATNDILPGIAKVNSYLNGHPNVPHIVTGEKPGPLLYFVDDLSFIQDEIGSYYWKKNPMGDYTDEPQDRGDHAMNVLKYKLSFLPQPAKIVVPNELMPKPWMLWHEQDA